jgi:glycosyltransferase involved in cell wall biosynthesis
MLNPLISVVIPVYNVEKYVSICIESIINQTYNNLEIILVNDGSTDSSRSICQKYCSLDSRISLINKENGGLGSARNCGIDNSKGDYICFVDSDDYVEHSFIQLLYQGIVDYNVKIVTCGRYRVKNDELTPMFELSKSEVYNSKVAISKIIRSDDIDVSVWDKMFHCSLFDNNKFNDWISEDIPVTIKALMSTDKIAHIGVPLYNYVYREGSITTADFNIKKMSVFKSLKYTKKQLLSFDQSLSREFNYLYGSYLTLFFFEIFKKKNRNIVRYKHWLKRSILSNLKYTLGPNSSLSFRNKLKLFIILIFLS